MKIFTQSLGSFAVVLLWGTTALSAQSHAAKTSAANATHHAAAASGEAFTASGDSVTASAGAVSSIAAVPVWMSGAALTGSGNLLAAVGGATVHAGVAVAHGAEKMWDFATGDPACRPALARERAVPPLTMAGSKTKDCSPGEAMRAR